MYNYEYSIKYGCRSARCEVALIDKNINIKCVLVV